MKANAILILLVSLLISLKASSPNPPDSITIYYERAPWFVCHFTGQTVDDLIKYARKDMFEPDVSKREYQIINLDQLAEPRHCFCPADSDLFACEDIVCAIVFDKGEKNDTICIGQQGVECFYNRRRICDSRYVRMLIDYLGENDEVFKNATQKAKELSWRAVGVYDKLYGD